MWLYWCGGVVVEAVVVGVVVEAVVVYMVVVVSRKALEDF